jgi:hypothetical protein
MGKDLKIKFTLSEDDLRQIAQECIVDYIYDQYDYDAINDCGYEMSDIVDELIEDKEFLDHIKCVYETKFDAVFIDCQENFFNDTENLPAFVTEMIRDIEYNNTDLNAESDDCWFSDKDMEINEAIRLLTDNGYSVNSKKV